MFCLQLFSLFFSGIVLITTIDVAQSKYVLHKIVATWEEAKLRCEREGALLASPIDIQLLQDMKSRIGKNNHTTAYFIGTRLKNNQELQFLSLEGIPLDDMPEPVLDMIEQLDPRDGDCLAMDSKSIRVVPCWERLPYICYTKCVGSGYVLSTTGSCYKFYRNHSTWNEANKTCTDDGGYLVIFNDENEAKTVVQMFGKPDRLPHSWVGIRDDTGSGHWRSVHGDRLEEIYNIWHKYSTNMYVGEACALVNEDAKLFDYFCNYYYHFICEKNN